MTINCRGKLLDLEHPKVMGILNLTPDSFFDGGKNSGISQVLERVEAMLSEGMDILDIGGQTTKPNSQIISAEEEWKRISNYLQEIVKTFPDLIISVDTFWSKVAERAIDSGVAIVNDISAGSIDENMFQTIARLQVPYVLMHMQGKPKNMQQHPTYQDVVVEVNKFFSEKIGLLKQMHVNDIIIDPGYGFGKSVEHNYALLKYQELLGGGDYPILCGVSRKTMICKVLGVNPKNALNGTTAIHMLALLNGAKILRVHDPKEAKQCIKLYHAYQQVDEL